MSSYCALAVHFVFGTKNREPWIVPAIERRVWEYLAAVARKDGIQPIRIGGVEDHVHALVGIPPSLAVSRAAQILKGASSRWIRATFPDLASFAWQAGYGAFSVSPSAQPTVAGYIERQREHHRRRTFAEEWLALLKKHGLEPAGPAG